MLILTGCLYETIRIGNDIQLVFLNIKGRQISLAIDAPKTISVHREEIFQLIRPAEKRE